MGKANEQIDDEMLLSKPFYKKRVPKTNDCYLEKKKEFLRC